MENTFFIFLQQIIKIFFINILINKMLISMLQIIGDVCDLIIHISDKMTLLYIYSCVISK